MHERLMLNPGQVEVPRIPYTSWQSNIRLCRTKDLGLSFFYNRERDCVGERGTPNDLSAWLAATTAITLVIAQ